MDTILSLTFDWICSKVQWGATFIIIIFQSHHFCVALFFCNQSIKSNLVSKVLVLRINTCYN